MQRLTFLFAAILGVASWLVPNHYPPWDSFHAELAMAVAFLIVLIGEALQRRGLECVWTPLLTVSLMLACVAPLQAAAGLIFFAGDAWMASAYLLAFCLAQMLGQTLAAKLTPEAVLRFVAPLFLAGSLLSVGLALYQWLGLRGLGYLVADLPPNGRPFANVGQPNQFSTMLFLGLTATWFGYENRQIRGWIAAAAGLFLQFGMVMSGSRAAWLLMGTGAVTLWAIQRRAALRVSRFATLSMAISFVALLSMWPPLSKTLLLSPGRQFAEQAAAGARPAHWAAAIDAVSRQPLTGYGWNQVSVSQSRVVIDHPFAAEMVDSSHNLLLDLLIWNGIPIGAAAFLFCIWWGRARLADARSATSLFPLLAVAGVFVHAMVEFPLSYAYFLLPVGLMMGVLDRPQAGERRRLLGRGTISALIASAATLLVVITTEYAQVEANFRLLRLELARIGTGRVESQAPALRLLTQWREYLQFLRTDPLSANTAVELAWMEKLVERFPNSSAQFKLAVAQSLNGNPELAGLTLRRLCSLHSAFVCRAHLAQWREFDQLTYPLLSQTPLPVPLER